MADAGRKTEKVTAAAEAAAVYKAGGRAALRRQKAAGTARRDTGQTLFTVLRKGGELSVPPGKFGCKSG
ncbi:MAG TPA: hypothetical protein DCF42_05845 [Lachnospiraceae bacterium]|nr:hypothetical protein [Lachnospiraceae bacterium]